MAQETTTEEVEATPVEEAEPEEGISEIEALRKGIFSSVVGFTMMSLAAFVDISELFAELIPGAGTILSIIIDLAALLFIGGWMVLRSGRIGFIPTKTRKRTIPILAKRARWLKRLKWLRPLLIGTDMIPIIGSIIPGWIVAVYLELKYG